MRDIKTEELTEPVATLVKSLSAENISVLIRDRGISRVAVAALLAGEEYQEYARWRAEQAWQAVDEIRKAFADLSESEIEQIVSESVEEVRRERHAPRKAS